MIVFERVSSLQTIRNICKRWIFATLFLLLFTLTPIISPVYATDAECAASNIEGFTTKCMPYLDPATGALLPQAGYYKCDDAIQCDTPDVQRCCVEPQVGSYGGECKDPAIDRKTIGAGDASGGVDFINIKPKTCTADEDELSASDDDVIIVPPLPAVGALPPGGIPPSQSIANYFNKDNDQYVADGSPLPRPVWQGSEGGKQMFDESVVFEIDQCDLYGPYGICLKRTKRLVNETFVYEERTDGSRGYFVHTGVFAHVQDKTLNGIEFKYRPREPRSGAKFPKNFACRLGNVFLTPLYGIVRAITIQVSNSDNTPDISLLCAQGTPQFVDPTKITFNADGTLSGFADTDCFCADGNSGPATAAVLLCTRYMADMEDVGAPWRLIVPVPDSGGNGSRLFTSLLFGGLAEDTSTIDEFRRRVKDDIDAFYDDPDDLQIWAAQLWNASTSTLVPLSFVKKFLSLDQIITPANGGSPSDVDMNKFRSNRNVKQYISCLACAKYGGFPSALGCMPMSKVDRFLSEGVLGIGITFAAAFSVLCIIFGAIQFQLSGGESAKVQKAQKLITQCVLGLLIIIFSIFLLRFVGVNLLRIYGLG